MSAAELLQQSKSLLADLFHKLDTDGTGTLPIETVAALLEQLGIDMDFATKVLKMCGCQRGLSCDYKELLEWLWGPSGAPSPIAESENKEQDLRMLGVSLPHLSEDLKFEMEELCSKGSLKPYVIATVRDIAPTIIKPAGEKMACPRDNRQGAAYVDAIRQRPHHSSGPHARYATHMLSYTWFYRVCDIIAALTCFCRERAIDDKNFYVWTGLLKHY